MAGRLSKRTVRWLAVPSIVRPGRPEAPAQRQPRRYSQPRRLARGQPNHPADTAQAAPKESAAAPASAQRLGSTKRRGTARLAPLSAKKALLVLVSPARHSPSCVQLVSPVRQLACKVTPARARPMDPSPLARGHPTDPSRPRMAQLAWPMDPKPQPMLQRMPLPVLLRMPLLVLLRWLMRLPRLALTQSMLATDRPSCPRLMVAET